MDSATRSPDLTDIAAGWLVALDAGTADPAAFAAWRDADVRHAVAFAEVAASWRALDTLRPLRSAVPPAAVPAVQETPRVRPTRRALLRAAAVSAALAATGGGVAYRAYARERAVTGVGERRTLRIGDGMTVDLNTDSDLAWRIDRDRTTLWLERGEVAVDLSGTVPVALMTPPGRFDLAPGAFDARLRAERCDLTVLEGQAMVAGGGVVRAGRRAVRGRDGTLVVQAADAIAIERARAWRQGMIVLDDDRLDAALAEYNRYLPRRIAIGDPRLASLRLGGSFSTKDPADFLAALQATFAIRVASDGGGAIVLTAR